MWNRVGGTGGATGGSRRTAKHLLICGSAPGCSSGWFRLLRLLLLPWLWLRWGWRWLAGFRLLPGGFGGLGPALTLGLRVCFGYRHPGDLSDPGHGDGDWELGFGDLQGPQL